MGKVWREIFICVLMALFLPGAVLQMCRMYLGDDNAPVMIEESITEAAEESEPEGMLVSVIMPDELPVQMGLEKYLVGVVLGEMPWDFELEALKAQTIAARTYACKVWESGKKHDNNSICTDAQCCQAYISPEEYLRSGGREEAIEKIQQAVRETRGQVLYYEDELIEATYFSCSGGYTEDALAVWGVEVPYLQAKSSPGEECFAVYKNQYDFSKEELEQLLTIELRENSEQWFTDYTYTTGGGVKTVCVGDNKFTGLEIRKKLGLSSTMFSTEPKDNAIRIISQGNGHRVGMSQYGADAMAISGKNCQEILEYYYPGAELTNYPEK